MNHLRRILYTSASALKMDRQALLALLHDARTYNEIDDITGVLLHDSGRLYAINRRRESGGYRSSKSVARRRAT